jgi:hypothetical protein
LIYGLRCSDELRDRDSWRMTGRSEVIGQFPACHSTAGLRPNRPAPLSCIYYISKTVSERTDSNETFSSEHIDMRRFIS